MADIRELETASSEYIKAIATNPIAIDVKLADLKHNSTISRLDNIEPKDLERLEKYKKNIKFLEEKKKEFNNEIS